MTSAGVPNAFSPLIVVYSIGLVTRALNSLLIKGSRAFRYRKRGRLRAPPPSVIFNALLRALWDITLVSSFKTAQSIHRESGLEMRVHKTHNEQFSYLYLQINYTPIYSEDNAISERINTLPKSLH